ncbi:hypothetical protein LTR08_004480 [Meristemomyces frigidus]|nr:hypothetical protein LTR08_004480 [Meristemomyces frigidus]
MNTSPANTDSTLDSSSLSHEFYQVMVGDTRMSVHGWEQLAEWSLHHSCFTAEELGKAMVIFERDWEVFCRWVVDMHGEYANILAREGNFSPDVILRAE